MVRIHAFDNRVKITNPGGVPKGITVKNFGTTSVTRNPIIASLLHRTDYIERMGTGINRMNSEMEKAGLEKPIFQIEGCFFKVTFMREFTEPNGIGAYSDSDGVAIESEGLARESEGLAIGSDEVAIENDGLAIESDRKRWGSDRQRWISDRKRRGSDR